MTDMKQRVRALPAAAIVIVCAALGTTVLAACGSSGPHAAPPATSASMPTTSASMPTTSATPASAFYSAMSDLWDQHMEYTYDTVLAFVAGSPTLPASLTRLQQNQTDIGNAVKPYYGNQAGDQLAALLHTHISDAVPVLTAAKKGDTSALNAANAAWYANAKQIGDFLAAANPSWPQAQMEDMMKTHITQTLAYATDALQGNWTKFIGDYGLAQQHMDQMANMLAQGIIAQFPQKFA